MRYTFLGGFLLWTAGVTALAAQAGPPPPSRPPLVGGADFISPMGEPFHSEDKLSGAEHWFAQADADHDGRLTRAEFRADAARFFHRLDTDHNGEIGPGEIEHYETVIAPEIRVVSTGSDYVPSGDDSTSNKPAYPDHLGAGRMSYIDLPEPVAAMDTNFDRGISIKEYEQAIARRFTQLDTNADGAITRDELPRLSSEDDGETRRRRHRGGSGGGGGSGMGGGHGGMGRMGGRGMGGMGGGMGGAGMGDTGDRP